MSEPSSSSRLAGPTAMILAMSTTADLERCLSYVRMQLRPQPGGAQVQARKLAITLSRQTGTGGFVIAQKAAQYLEAHRAGKGSPWTVFDKDLVAVVLKEHHLPEELGRFMPEDRVSQLGDMVEELLGLHPPFSSLLRATTETILHLAELGNVILVGRAANVITARLPHVFHVRLVGSLERRVERLARFDQCAPDVARATVEKSDRGRARYLAKNFGKDIDDALLYDLILNTDRISDECAAKAIAEISLGRCA